MNDVIPNNEIECIREFQHSNNSTSMTLQKFNNVQSNTDHIQQQCNPGSRLSIMLSYTGVDYIWSVLLCTL